MDSQGVPTEKVDKGFDLIVTVTSDYYRAYLNIEKHAASISVTEQDILDALARKNITYGIDLDAVKSAAQDPDAVNGLLVAEGVPHENGLDGELIFNVNKEKQVKPRMLPNGRVDFKDINFLELAYANDLLATRTLPTAGKDGMTVTGREIKSRPGKPVNFKAGKNVRVSEDGLMLFAEKSGSVQIDGDRVSITEVLEIRKDVGPETGNIEFMGNVIIFGNVLSGYEIHSDGDVEINGIVECAHIFAKGNININGVVQGNDIATLEAGGNLTVKVLNNCRAIVKGDIKCDTILHCHITCDGSIVAEGKKGAVVGGELNVRLELKARIVGSEMGTITKVRMGVDSKIMDDFKNMAEQIRDTQENINKLNQGHRQIQKQYEASHGNPDVKVLLDRTENALEQMNGQLREQQKQLRELNELIDQLRDARLVAQTAYPGVKIRIGNSYYNVKDTLQGVRIQKDGGDIRLMPY